jgi:hypothetical protein
MVAISNAMMASAAYFIGSAADEVVVTPSGHAGSIGVYTVHIDQSKMNESLGIKPTIVSAGKFKVEGNSAEPLTEEARGALQQMVDDAYQQFVGRWRSIAARRRRPCATGSARAACSARKCGRPRRRDAARCRAEALERDPRARTGPQRR